MITVATRAHHECLYRLGNATILLPQRVPSALASLADAKVSTNPYGAFLHRMQTNDQAYGWFFEDDVYYHGDLLDFVDSFAIDTSDLLAFAVREHPNFYTFKTCSLLRGSHSPCKMTFHVTRVSKRFAEYTLALYDKGMRCHHEVVLPTLCRQTSWCVMRALPLTSVGVLHALGGANPNKCCRLSSYSLVRRRFFHPAKCRATQDYSPTTMRTRVSSQFCTDHRVMQGVVEGKP